MGSSTTDSSEAAALTGGGTGDGDRDSANANATTTTTTTNIVSETASGTKRKRDESSEAEEDNQNDRDDPGPVPDAAPSYGNTGTREGDRDSDDGDDDDDLSVPVGGFPSSRQLSRILIKIAALSKHSTNTDKKNVVDLLQRLKSWSNANDNPVKRDELKLMFIKLGGVLHFIFVMERFMDDAEIPFLVAHIVYNCLSEIPEQSIAIVKSSCIDFLDNGGLRIFLLTAEEKTVSAPIRDALKVGYIWGVFYFVLSHTREENLEKHHDKITDIVESEIPFAMTGTSDVSRYLEIEMMRSHMNIHAILLKHFADDFLTVYRQGNILDRMLDWLLKYRAVWMSSKMNANAVLQLYYWFLKKNLLSSNGIIGWVPLLIESLLKYHSDPEIEKRTLKRLNMVMTLVDKRALEKTDLCETLVKLIKDDNTSEESKTKYRELMSKLVSP